MSGIDATFHKGLTIPGFVSVLYKSPGIPTRKVVLESPQTRLSTLMDIVLEKTRPRSVGVTGTKGKSTVASLIFHILKSAGRDAVLFGNIGVADMRLFEADGPERIYVLELSSYQCEHITRSPHVAVLTNLYPEHLNHHGSFESYREAKLNIARFQTDDDLFVNGTDIKTSFKGLEVQPDSGPRFETKLLGEHNQRNCALAVAAVAEYDVTEEEAREHIKTFEPLPYRLEKIGEFKGVTFYDDSLATVPEATFASIKALPRVDTIILGGEDRGISFTKFADELKKSSIKTFIVFPDTGPVMVTKVQDRTVVPVSSMEEAVKAAFQNTPPGGTVLLSNASPSFNLFKDYKDKSAQYREWIQKLGH
jgi:UDP-N-acetylmuramoylalanine--D-glutamate ligase